ncbi:MAG: helicase, partial [Bacteroidetes bacterium]|nr:helicase [Bacteroidota bacterium]
HFSSSPRHLYFTCHHITLIKTMDHSQILTNFKIEALNDMQKAMVETVPHPNDVVLISPTGSGKTLAFLLPALQLLQKDKAGVQILIVVPSRELAIQIEQVWKQMSTGFKINCCYGGHSTRIEKNNLNVPPAVLLGTPGRIAFHIRNENITLHGVHTLILDEFDKSLEGGFQDEISYITTHMRGLEKRILTSATKLDDIPRFVGLRKTVTLDFTAQFKEQKANLELREVNIPEGLSKIDGLCLLIGKLGAHSKIVFCNHREAVKRISTNLVRLGVAHGVYHGEMEQIEREKALIKLRNGSTTLLITTDLASRGLDIPEIECIIHYQLPATADAMTHRNGRTARMHATGTAFFLLEEKDHLPYFVEGEIEEEEIPETFTQPPPPDWKTLYIAAGKKDKINKTDIVGLLLQKGGLQKDEVGRIEVLDNAAYAAVKSSLIEKTLLTIKNEKIKNKKVKFEIAG